MTGTVVAVCISGKKRERKIPSESARLRENHGIVGDAHAGEGERQVSLLPILFVRDDLEASRLHAALRKPATEGRSARVLALPAGAPVAHRENPRLQGFPFRRYVPLFPPSLCRRATSRIVIPRSIPLHMS
ncbi:MAG TPA: hypothetical protein VJ386_07885 [Candidatus Deferrimicrobiaceae bacterium]|nr:hypothetical protein [Candidatus Deferrimicrobiaceae bacterium]